ncbi:MAG: hypothetical protein J6P83_08485 [Bacteroidales bacterium]|nr:hypothetical protein [Bacteroidales bacterium]
MSLLALIFGLLTDSLLAAIVGLVGSRRRIGFGWAFLLSVVFTPLIGLIVTLCTPKLPNKERKWGCFGALVGFVVAVIIVVLVLVLMPEWYEQLRLWIDSLR